MPSWYLDYPAQIAAQAPYTFYFPSPETLARIGVGQAVKLIFRFESDDSEAPGAERLQVLVASRTEDGSFVGRLDSDPAHIRDLRRGDPILFRPSHIVGTEHDHLDNRVARFLARCYVTKRILLEGASVGLLYREPPTEEPDSGWRILAGDETDTYLQNGDNTLYVPLGTLLNRDDTILPLLDAPVGAAYQRAKPDGEFVAVEV